MIPGMSDPERIDAYIMGLTIDQMEPYLEDRGFGSGLVLFAIPDLGIQFKCRVSADNRSLELAALLTLLQFLNKKLAKQKVDRIRVHASDPAFVFAVANQLKDESGGNGQINMIKKWLKNRTVEIAIVPRNRNLARLNPSDIPSIPRDATPVLDPKTEDNRPRFRPLQKGIDLQ